MLAGSVEGSVAMALTMRLSGVGEIQGNKKSEEKEENTIESA